MLYASELGATAFPRNRKISDFIRQGKIGFGGNQSLKIYGKLNCASGKRMKVANQVFFAAVKEAETLGYRPCGNCMYHAYKKWKNGFIQ